jgi:hypothetical protein
MVSKAICVVFVCDPNIFSLHRFCCIDLLLESEIDVGSQLIVATATATAVHCEAMPPPRILEISRTIAVQDEEDEQLVRLQRLIETFSARNRLFLNKAGKNLDKLYILALANLMLCVYFDQVKGKRQKPGGK